MMKRNVTTCLTLTDLSQTLETVRYVPRGPPGAWARFLEYLQEKRGVMNFEAWSVNDFFRAIVEFSLGGNVGTPFVCSQMYTDTEDDTPAYKLCLFDVTWDQLLHLESEIPPSWFVMEITPKEDGLHTVTLAPKRSLMKLIYRNLE